jgi:hypothetical protein
MKMYGSTPTGSKNKVSYYRSNAEIDGKKLRLPTNVVDDQILDLIEGIAIDPSLIPAIKERYQAEIKNQTQDDKAGNLKRLKNQLASLEKEEARLARLFMTDKINEHTYDQLRQEWVEKTRNIQATVKELEVDVRQYLDNLEIALVVLTNLPTLYERFKEKKRTALLQVLIKRININREGEIISCELHSPFTYLSTLATQLINGGSGEGGRSTSVSVSTPQGTCFKPLCPRSLMLGSLASLPDRRTAGSVRSRRSCYHSPLSVLIQRLVGKQTSRPMPTMPKPPAGRSSGLEPGRRPRWLKQHFGVIGAEQARSSQETRILIVAIGLWVELTTA